MAENLSKLKSKHLLIAGSDEYQVKGRTAALLKEIGPEDPMNFEVVDGQADNVDQAVQRLRSVHEALMTLPFMGGRKVVHFKSVNCMADSVIGRSEAVVEQLANLLEIMAKVPPAEAQLVISAIGVDKRRTFYKQFEKQGLIEIYDQVDLRSERSDEAWLEEVERLMRAAGLQPEDGVAERMVELIGNDMRALHMELEKLAVYTHPNGIVSLATVKLLVAGNREMMVWDFCDAVTLGRSSEAVHIFRQLIAQGESEVGILILLSGHLRLAALCRHLAETGRIKVRQSGSFVNADVKPEAMAMLPKNKKGEAPKPFRIARVVKQAERLPSKIWFRAIDRIHDTYLRVLSSGGDKVRTLESLVLEVCLLRG